VKKWVAAVTGNGFDTCDLLRLAALERVKSECGVRGFLSASAAACLSLACAPALAQNAQPAVKATAPSASEPAKIRRAETIVDDNWTVTCAETDQGGAKRQCSAVLKIAQSDANGAQRIVFTWVIGHQEGKLVSALSMPSGVLIPPGVQIKIGDKETRKLGYSLCQPDHCEALLPLEDQMVKSLDVAATTEVTVYAVNGAEVKFTVNMKGFAQAVADLGK
jgi:invasion protein IalB